MAALQSFQAEIEDIRNRELAKTRAQSQPDAPRRGPIDHKSAPKVRKKNVGGETPATSPVSPKLASEESNPALTDIERTIEARILVSLFTILTDLFSHRAHYYLRREARPKQGI
jgi:hypothetical protein